jgi:hypothetical protein
MSRTCRSYGENKNDTETFWKVANWKIKQGGKIILSQILVNRL